MYEVHEDNSGFLNHSMHLILFDFSSEYSGKYMYINEIYVEHMCIKD